ncbi:MAG TPA: hypothetical protein VKX40_16020 [Aequorivita sp.]|nr:hypothetical protein [Aequorivita sp.]
MKNLIGIVFISLLLLNCSKSDKIDESSSIVGKWKLEATLIGTGGSVNTNPIENGQTIVFRNDQAFEILDSSMECHSGTYTITENSSQNFNMDIVSLVCDNGNLIKYAFSFEEGKLLLSFIVSDGSTGCDEICAERYVKLPDE